MVDFRALETFISVVTLRSFRRAAEKLNTTQPAISQRIAALEREIGHQVIDRSGRQVAPTAIGRRLLVQAERLIAARADMLAELANPAVVSGSLALGVNETIMHTWLPVLLERLAKIFPGIDVDIDVDISESLRERVVSQDIDLALMLGPVVSPLLQSCDLCRFPLAFVASRHLPLQHAPLGLAELTPFPILTFARNTLPYQAIQDMFARPGLPKSRIRASTSLATIVRMTLDGIGVAVIPPAIVARELEAGHLIQLRLPIELPDLLCTAVWRRSPDTRIVQAVAGLAGDIAREYAEHSIQ